MRKIENIPTGDMRLEKLHEELSDFIFEKAHGLPVPSIVGVLTIIIKDMLEQQP